MVWGRGVDPDKDDGSGLIAGDVFRTGAVQACFDTLNDKLAKVQAERDAAIARQQNAEEIYVKSSDTVEQLRARIAELEAFALEAQSRHCDVWQGAHDPDCLACKARELHPQTPAPVIEERNCPW
jgi:acetyl/propionyl-CoA carboxylase alpha subunit